jgi:predicted helicase
MALPLYLYPDSKDLFATNERVPNLKKEIVDKLGTVIGRRLGDKGFAPEDLLDYIYAVLHTPPYRETYKEFLKIDFPRVPYPKDAKHFDALVKQGAILRGLHLLESDDVDTFITSYPNDGDNIVGKPKYSPPQSPEGGGSLKVGGTGGEGSSLGGGRVWLNGTQYFDGVPEVAWQFYIGGYQPAQKWLKDRIGRRLDYEDIRHYQRMIVALARTAEVMTVLDGLY